MSSNTSYRRRIHHSHSEDTLKEKIIKYIFSFFTFIFLTVFSFLICADTVFVNPYYFEKSFTTYEYTLELYNIIDDYSKSVCKKENIGTEVVQKTVTFEAVKKINDSYIGEKLKTDNPYNDETYSYFISRLESDLKEQLDIQLNKESAVQPEAAEGTDGIINDIVSFVNNAVSASHAEKLYSVTRVADTAIKIVAVVTAALTAVFAVIVCYTGEKRYRGLRYISYSAGASALTDLVFAVIFALYSKNISLDVYPVYLQYAFANHMNNSMLALYCASISLFAVNTAVLAFCWKLKRKNK